MERGSNDAEFRKVIMTDLMLIARIEKPETAIKMIDDVLKEIEFPIEQKLEIFQIKLGVLKKSKDDAAVDALLEEMINFDGVQGATKERLMVKKIMLMVGSGRKDAAIGSVGFILTIGVGQRRTKSIFLDRQRRSLDGGQKIRSGPGSV